MKKTLLLMIALLAGVSGAWATVSFTEGKPYVIKHSSSGRYLNLEAAGTNATISSEYSFIYFTASEGGYIISNGTNYLYSNTTEWHAWANSSNSSVWEIEEVDGVADAYTIHQSVYNGGGYLGSDGTSEGDPCFNDKGKTNFIIVEADVLFKLNYLKDLKVPALFKSTDIALAITAIKGGSMTSEQQENMLTTIYKSAEGKTFYAASNFSGTNTYLNVGDTKATCTSTALTTDAIMTVEYAGNDKFYLKGNNGKYICTPSSTNNVAPSTTDNKAEAGQFYIGNREKTTDNLVYFTTQKTGNGNTHEALHFIDHTDGLTGWGFRADASQWQIETISLGGYDDDDDITVNYTLTNQNSNTFVGSVSKKFADLDLYGLVSTLYNPTCITWSDNGEGTITYSANVTTPFIAATNFAGITYWYNIRMNSNQTNYLYYDSGASNKYSFSSTIGENTNAYLWGYTGDPISGFQLYNREAGSTIALDTNEPCTMSASGTSAHFFLTSGVAGSQGETADSYFAMYHATPSSCLNKQGNNIGRYSVDAGCTFMINRPTVSYTFTDLNGQTYEGTYNTSLIGSEEPTITGCYNYTLSNKAWSGTVFTADIKFPFFVSSNDKNVYIYMANHANHCWKAVGTDIKDFGVVPSSADAAYDWQIIPTLTNNAFSFKIKNRSTGTYIYSTATSESHNQGTVVLNATGTAFTYTNKGWCFPQTKANGTPLYISENSSSSTDQYVGIWTSHNGTAARFYIPKITNGFYRLKGKTSGKCLAAGMASNNKYAMTNAENATTIFYYDGTTLTNLGSGLCNGMSSTSWAWVIGSSASTVEFQDGVNMRGYAIKSSDAYFYDNGDGSSSADRGASATIEGNTNARYCSWQVEEMKALPITISSVGYTTLYAPVNLEIPSGVTAYTAVDGGSYLSLTAIVGGIIPANQGVILAGTAGETYNFNITEVDGTVGSNVLTGTAVAISRPANSYVLSKNSEGVVAFYKDGASTIPGFKAYLAASGGSVKAFRFADADAIESISGVLQSEGRVIYNLAGQRMNKLQKGVNIVNGKKVLVK